MVSDQPADAQPGLTLDVSSLMALQRSGVPHTDDSMKYQYRLKEDGYGTVQSVSVVTGYSSQHLPRPLTAAHFLTVFPKCSATVVALFNGQALVSEVTEGQRCGVILDQTCFYAEQGGQSHDRGYFLRDGLQVSS